MAQIGFTPIQIYYSSTALAAPTAGNLLLGELALNAYDGKLYYKNTSGVVKVLADASNSGGSFATVTVTGSISGSSNQGPIRQGILSYSDTNIWQSYQTSVNSYAQVVMQNTSSGTAASTDFVVSNDIGTGTTYYGNFGMNSSGFTGSGSFSLPNAVYVSSTTADLVLGTITSNPIRFVVNSGATDALFISTAGNLGLGTSSPTSRLHMSGGGSFAPWATSGVGLKVDSATYTSTAGLTGTVAANSFAAPTFAATTAAQTITNAATLYVDAAPIAGANVSAITNAYSLYVASGTSYFGGDATFNGAVNFNVPPVFTGPVTADYTLGTKLLVTGADSSATWGVAGIGLRINAGIYTDTTSTGTVAIVEAAHGIAQPTFAATNVTTFTNAATLYLANSPASGTNVTITNPYSLYVAAGNSYFGGYIGVGTSASNSKLRIGGNLTTAGNIWSSNGISFSVDSATYTSSTTYSGNLYAATFSQPTFVAASSSNVDSAATVYISGAPIAGTNVSISNQYSLFVNSGNVWFNSLLTANGGIISSTGIINPANNNGVKLKINGNVSSASWGVGGTGLVIEGGNYTDSSSSGTVANIAIHAIARPNLNSTNVTTYTNASTLYIANSPNQIGNATITNGWSLYIAAGNAYFGGATTFNGAVTFNTAPSFTGTLTANYTLGTKLLITGADSAATWGVSGIGLRVDGGTYTDTTSTGTVATVEAIHAIAQPTIAATNVTTFTNSATLYVANAPAAGTNVTITNPYALYIASGSSYFGGAVTFAVAPTFAGTITANYATGTKLQITGADSASTWGVSGIGLRIDGGTYTDTTSTGTVAIVEAIHAIAQPTIAASSTTTFTNSATLYVANAPAAGTNVTLTNPYALYIASGATYFGGAVTFAISPTFSGTITASYASGTKLLITGNESIAPWTTSGPALQIASGTYTSTSTLSGTVVANSIAVPTFAATTASQTITDAATLYIAGAPVAGTNVTITNPWALYIPTNNAFFGGGVTVQGTAFGTYPAASFGTNGISLNVVGNGVISAAGYSGTVAINSFGVTQLGATTAGQTITNAATVYIAGTPAAGTNTTITNRWALYITAGDFYLGGTKLQIAGTSATYPASSFGTTGIALSVAAATYTSATTLPTLVAGNSFGGPLFAATTVSQTIVDAATLYISSPPTAGANTTITNSWALYASGDIASTGTRIKVTGSSATYPAAQFGTTGVGLSIAGATYTSAAGVSGTVAAHSIASPTFAATTVTQTITNGATLYIAGSPSSGTNVTITNPYSLYVNGGNVYFGGLNLKIAGSNVNQDVANYGLTGCGFSIAGGTYTSSTTMPTAVAINSFAQSTLNATTTSTIANASTIYIANAPNFVGNATITNAWALYAAGGDAFLGGGRLKVNSSSGAGTYVAAEFGTTGIGFSMGGGTYTSATTLPTFVAINSIAAPFLAAGTASQTVANSATLYIAGAPTQSTNVTLTNAHAILIGAGNITIGSTAPASRTTNGTNLINMFNGTAPSGALTNGVSLYAASGDLNFMDAAGNGYRVGFRNVPPVGAKTASYTLATTDVGKYVELGTSGAIVIPNSTFSSGDIVSVFNNTGVSATITVSTTNGYIAGTNTNRTSVTLATRGVATILFISGTLCVISGNVV